jgi:hypothetical protein
MAALAEPFDPAEVHFKPGAINGNRALALAFITARAVMDRLDEVLGVDGWEDTYEPLPNGSVVCCLTCRIDGHLVRKTDVGSPSEQDDEGDRTKAAFSDALKRAAVHFGVFRYGYRLPSQWCNCTTMERGGRTVFKSWLQQPVLPAWALPKSTGLSLQREAQLLDLIASTRSDERRLLDHFQVSRLADLTDEQADRAESMLRQKQAAAKSKPAPKDSPLVKTLPASIGAKRAEAAAGRLP